MTGHLLLFSSIKMKLNPLKMGMLDQRPAVHQAVNKAIKLETKLPPGSKYKVHYLYKSAAVCKYILHTKLNR